MFCGFDKSKLVFNRSTPDLVSPIANRKMEVLHQLRSSFRSHKAAETRGSNNSINASDSSTDSINNSDAAMQKKRARHICDLCGKRLLKLAGWRNYFTLPCKCRHVFCKQCITDRLQCRQKVMRSASFDLMWTFPCPGHAQCGQQLTVDFARGSSYSKNLVAKDIESEDESWEQDYDADESDNVLVESDVSVGDVCGDDGSCLREIG